MDQTTKRAVLVTGAGKRVGRVIALDLAAHGWSVGVHYNHSRHEADDVVAEIRERGGQAAALQADLASEPSTAALIPAAVERLGPLTGLVNNASIFERDDALTATRDSWDRHLATNLRAPFVLMQDFARQLPENQQGCIVNIIDQRVWNLTPNFMSYTVSKAGLWTLTRTMAMALAPRIRVNAVGPGPTLPSSRQSQDDFDTQCRSLPLARGTSPQEIGDAVRFILQAPALTGQMIALDGGEHLGWAQPTQGFIPVE